MLTITKNSVGPNVLAATLAGDIGPDMNLEGAIGPVTSGELQVSCKGVTRINSVGVKLWIQYFSALRKAKVSLRFTECPPILVQQMNMISNFALAAEVSSLYVPFSCEKCGTELVGLFNTPDIQKLNFEIPALKCTKCGGSAEFDDVPAEYFAFLQRT